MFKVNAIETIFITMLLCCLTAVNAFAYRGEFDDKYDPSDGGGGLIPALIVIGIVFAIWRSGTKK